MIGRRGFIGGCAAAVAVSPSRGQQPSRPVVGYIGLSLGVRQRWLAAFRNGLASEGFVEGRNVAIEYRDAGDGNERIPELLADLIGRKVAALATTGTAAALAAQRATTTIPIVFAIPADPVRVGLVRSFNRPGGNVTGVSFLVTELIPKRFALLQELLPAARRIAVLVNPANRDTMEPAIRDAVAASARLGLETRVVSASTAAGIVTAFADAEGWGAQALFLGGDPFFNSERALIAAEAARRTLPANYHLRDYVDAGGLMSYGPDLADSNRQAGVYVGRILKGERPADLPVVQPVRFELVINLKTAKALGLTVPSTLLAQADQVIE